MREKGIISTAANVLHWVRSTILYYLLNLYSLNLNIFMFFSCFEHINVRHETKSVETQDWFVSS